MNFPDSHSLKKKKYGPQNPYNHEQLQHKKELVQKSEIYNNDRHP